MILNRFVDHLLDCVDVHQLYCFFQWSITNIADGAYTIVGRRGDSDVPLCTGDGNELICDSDGEHTSWTIEARGDTYVSAFFMPYRPMSFHSCYLLGTGLEMLQTPRPSILLSVLNT